MGPQSNGKRFAVAYAEFFLFLVLWLGLLLAGRSAMLRDPGSFWHVAAGEKMLSVSHVLRDDPFSFTFAGHAWVADQWLAECGMAIVHRLAGWDGLLLLTAALLAGIYTYIASRLFRAGLHVLPSGVLLAFVLLTGSPQFHVRPLVLTIGLLSLTFAWLTDVEAGRKRVGQLWWLVPLFALWVNVHGGVLAGMGTVGLCVLGWSIARIVGKDSPLHRPRDAVEAALLLLAIVATALLNPYGVALPKEWLQTLLMPLPSIIEEHARLDLADPVGWAALALAAGYLVVLIGAIPQRLRITWLLPLVWFVLALQRVRNAPLFAVVTAIAIADALPYSRVGWWLDRREMLSAPRPSVGWRPAVLSLVVVVAALAVQLAGISVPVVGREWARFDPTRWPVELLPKLAEINQSDADGARIFNDLSFGGFLIYHAPRLKVFVDDRCSLYGADFLQAYDHARTDAPAQIDGWQRQYGFAYALVQTDGRFDRHLSATDSWTRLGRTPVATLYERRLGVPPPVR
jgi:hypothetical protein